MALCSASAAQVSVANGSSVAVTFDTPNLGTAGVIDNPDSATGTQSWSGVPTLDSFTALECDLFSDDKIKGAQPVAPSPDHPNGGASITISNNGGDLSGPNGDVLNGGLEGDSIEVKMCWNFIVNYDSYIDNDGNVVPPSTAGLTTYSEPQDVTPLK